LTLNLFQGHVLPRAAFVNPVRDAFLVSRCMLAIEIEDIKRRKLRTQRVTQTYVT